MRRRSFYKYFSERQWADRFLDEGEILFRSLSYFRDHEDNEVRGDESEGTAILRPKAGLLVNNLTQKTTFTIPGAAFESSAKVEEIFVYCVSRSLTNELRERFRSVACVEILDIPAFCARIQAALPAHAIFPGPRGRTRIGQRVTYYADFEDVNPRWALPDVMATWKRSSYAWQDEFRFVFSLTDALDFEKVITRLVGSGSKHTPDAARHQTHLVKVGALRDLCRFVPDEGRCAHKPMVCTPEVKLAEVRNPRSEACCLVDESGSLSRAIKEPFRVGFLMTCRPERLQEDIRRLKRELPPRGRSGEYHAREDDSQTRAMMRGLLCLNTEPQMYIVEWRKDQFADTAFFKGTLQVLADSNPLIASFAVTAADIAANFSIKGFSLVEIIVEATVPDLVSNHRTHRQALNQVLPVMFEKQAKRGGAPDGTRTEIRVSTVRKKDCPILSFVDYWLWAYSRHQDRQDRNAFPAELEARTHVRVMTPEEIGAPGSISGVVKGED